MECSHVMEAALKAGTIDQKLFKGSRNKELVTDLQRVLFELGFRKELKWDSYNADGDYGKATSAAVAAFGAKNGIATDGTKVTVELAKSMLQRHDFLPGMYILWDIHKSDLRSKLRFSKGTPMSITSVQIFLNEMGYGRQLNFARFGADGLYGSSTRSAIIAYAKDHGLEDSDGDLVTRALANFMIEDINVFQQS